MAKKEGDRQQAIGNSEERSPRRRAYLSFKGEADQIVTGVGLFAKGIPPEPVADSIARQFETDEMKALGWVVEWRDFETSTSALPAAMQAGEKE